MSDEIAEMSLEAVLETARRLAREARSQGPQTPLLPIRDFYDAVSLLAATAPAFGRHLILAAVRLNRFDGLVATLNRREMNRLLEEIATRMRLIVGADAPIAHMGRGVIVTCLSFEAPLGLALPDSVLPDAFLPDALLKMFHGPVVVEGQLVYLPATIGIARYPEHGTGGEELVNAAWLAAQANAKAGGAKCHVYHPEITQRLRRKRFVEHALRQTLSCMAIPGELDWGMPTGSVCSSSTEDDAFELVYQPKVDLENLTVRGVEALLRWNDPEVAAGPGEFIAIAEETGLIVPLGRWIVHRALADQRRWRAGGTHLKLAINVSPAQLASSLMPRFPEFLAAEMTAAESDPASVEVEITEGIMADPGARAAIAEIAALGVHIAVDDFGKFYSNLAILSSIPASTLKIDKEFVDDIVGDDKKRIVAQQVVTLARELGMRSIMEGVETSEQLEILSTLGCDAVQGYVFSRPLAAELVPLAQSNIAMLVRSFGGRRSFRRPSNYPALLEAVDDCLPEPVPDAARFAEARKPRILLIDDELDLCDAVAIGLERLGYEVGAFLNPILALSELAKAPYAWDLVITDERMPGMNGLQLLQAVKAIRRELPVLLWTGYGAEATEELARAHGADAYLEKPIAGERLAEEVRIILAA
jgi:EAL domain-containing protein (putative c-di-GMP-specific phosphodiesterase class I)/GGDEF domain-containing protein